MDQVVESSTLSPTTYTIYAVYIGVLFVVGIPVYLLSFKFFLKHILHRHKVRQLTPYLMNICAANFMSLVIQFPIVFAASIKRGWTSLGYVPCYVAGIACGTCNAVVIITLTLMSVKLFRTIEKDGGNHDDVAIHQKANPIKLAVTWITGVLMFVPTTVGWNSMVTDGPHCSLNWRVDSITDSSYLMVIVMVSFVVPLAVFILYFIKITRYLMRHHSHDTGTLHQMRLRVLHIDARNLVGITTLVYLVLWLPYWFYGFSTLFGRQRIKNGDLSIIPWSCVSLSVVHFPFIYIAMNKRFRKTLLSMVGWKNPQVGPTIVVENTETLEVLSNAFPTVRPGSPSILIPRSPLINRAFRLSEFEDVSTEIVQDKSGISSTTVSRLIRCSIHAAHEPDAESVYDQTRRNTTIS